MRHAILITAYKDLYSVYQMLEYFDSDFEIFIHIDKKCKEDYSCLQQRPYTHVYKTFTIDWGDFNHLQAIILLCRESFKYSECNYFHLITGSDYPIVPLSEFKAFFSKNCQNNFVEHFPLPRAGWGSEGGIERIRYYWFRPLNSKVSQYTLKIQRKILHTYRPFGFFNGKLYGGGTYWSVSRNAISSILDYLSNHPQYLHRFRHTHIPEEICFPTLWKGLGVHLTNNHLRYIDWSENKANPKVLTEADFNRIISSDYVFARKIEQKTSSQLIQLLKSHLEKK